jgi:hypothetical protein
VGGFEREVASGTVDAADFMSAQRAQLDLREATDMSTDKILVVYYSRTGTTRSVARMLAERLGCRLEEIVDPTPRSGLRGYLRCMVDIGLRRRTRLSALKEDPSKYQLVIVGTPVWGSSVSTPVRSYLLAMRERPPHMAFFLTHGGTGRERVFRQMRKLAKCPADALLSVTEHEFDRGQASARVDEFVAHLRAIVGEQPEQQRRAAS